MSTKLKKIILFALMPSIAVYLISSVDRLELGFGLIESLLLFAAVSLVILVGRE